jgi:hypothetical protein
MKKLFTLLSSITLISIFAACGSETTKVGKFKQDLSRLNTAPIKYDLSEYIFPDETYIYNQDSEQKIIEKTIFHFADKNVTANILKQTSAHFLFLKEEFNEATQEFTTSGKNYYKYVKNDDSSVSEYEGIIVDEVLTYPTQAASKTFIYDDNITLVSYNEDSSISYQDVFSRFYQVGDTFLNEFDKDSKTQTTCKFVGHLAQMNSKDTLSNIAIPNLDYSDVLKMECEIIDDKNIVVGEELFYYAKGIGLVLSFLDSDMIEDNIKFHIQNYTIFQR